jgi:hypothetical protein
VGQSYPERPGGRLGEGKDGGGGVRGIPRRGLQLFFFANSLFYSPWLLN